jgi:hypothetical protein
MTPADRMDELLRTELRRADDLVVTDRYAAVVARSRQRTRRRRAGALVTALVVAVSALGGVTAAVNLQHDDQTAPAVPSEAQLHGTWTRNVDGDRWTVTFAAGAVLVIDPPAGTDEAIDGASYATASSTLRLDAFTNSSCYAASRHLPLDVDGQHGAAAAGRRRAVRCAAPGLRRGVDRKSVTT